MVASSGTPRWSTWLWAVAWLLQTACLCFATFCCFLAFQGFLGVAVQKVEEFNGMKGLPPDATLEAMMAKGKFWLAFFGATYVLNFNVSLFAFYSLNVRKLIIWGAIAMVLVAILTIVVCGEFFYSQLV